jgi:N-glycosylase/DNA lyase
MLVDAHGFNIGPDTREASEKWLMHLRDLGTFDAREELLKFIGVGRKVADCVLLMSLDKVFIRPVLHLRPDRSV